MNHKSKMVTALRWSERYSWGLIAGPFLCGYVMLFDNLRPISDEGFHVPQIYQYQNGNFEHLPALTTFGTYHGCVAFLSQILGQQSLLAYRLVSLAISVLAIGVFRDALRLVGIPDRIARWRILQFAFLPILFPLFFLIYTDAWALLFILLCLKSCLKQRHAIAAFWGLVAILFRQTAVFWIGFAALLALNPLTLVRSDIRRWLARLRCLWPYFSVLLLFVVFVLWNDGVAVGDRSAHGITFNITNVMCLLLLLGVCHLPVLLREQSRYMLGVRVFYSIGLVALGVLLSLCFYDVSHPYNQINLDYYYRNGLFLALNQNLLARVSFGIFVGITLAFVLRSAKEEPRLWLWLPVAACSVVFMPLLEFRYAIPAIAIFILLRRASTERVEVWVAMQNIFLGGMVFLGVERGVFFP